MRVVLDTNCLLVSFSLKSRFRKIQDDFLLGKYKLLVSNDIFYEYIELFGNIFDSEAAVELSEIILNAEDIIFVNIFYKLNIISSDPDDNKFVDCAIAGNADYIVTDDKHFEELKKIDFPKINTITTEEFLKILSEN